MGEATDASGDVGPVATVFRGAERCAPRRFILGPGTEGNHLSLSDQHGGRRGGWRRRWGPRPIIMVLKIKKYAGDVKDEHPNKYRWNILY